MVSIFGLVSELPELILEQTSGRVIGVGSHPLGTVRVSVTDLQDLAIGRVLGRGRCDNGLTIGTRECLLIDKRFHTRCC